MTTPQEPTHAIQASLREVRTLAEKLARSLGPGGQATAIDAPAGSEYLTKGSQNTRRVAGDGNTTTALLAAHLFVDAAEETAQGRNAVALGNDRSPMASLWGGA